MNYYNEFDPYAAQWLRNLIAAGLIPAGDVDERSVEDVQPAELRGYTQCHFFAGIGGWSLALAIAGWPVDRPVWTGSCPCQPFSAAGKGAGFDDQRHLWPAWFHLIRECRPIAVFGEQVEGAVKHGWLDLVQADMEGTGYALGAAVLGAHSAGAPHIRQRLYWVADSNSQRRIGQRVLLRPQETGRHEADILEVAGRRAISALGDGDGDGDGDGGKRIVESCFDAQEWQESGKRPAGPSSLSDVWSGSDWLSCRDGKARPVEPGTFPLAHGIPGRVGRLRAYGNAIVPQVAAKFVEAFLQQAAAEARAA